MLFSWRFFRKKFVRLRPPTDSPKGSSSLFRQPAFSDQPAPSGHRRKLRKRKDCRLSPFWYESVHDPAQFARDFRVRKVWVPMANPRDGKLAYVVAHLKRHSQALFFRHAAEYILLHGCDLWV